MPPDCHFLCRHARNSRDVSPASLRLYFNPLTDGRLDRAEPVRACLGESGVHQQEQRDWNEFHEHQYALRLLPRGRALWHFSHRHNLFAKHHLIVVSNYDILIEDGTRTALHCRFTPL
jgi:hypothetical protein